MKIAAILLSIILFLSACSKGGNRNAQPLPVQEATGAIAPETVPQNIPPAEPALKQMQTLQKYVPDHTLSMQETIENYFSLQYDIYTGMRYFDISCLIDTSQQRLKNELVWLETLTLRRQLITQNQFCYVETRKYPYTISFNENAEDDRMEFWRSHNIGAEGGTAVNFTITGEKGKAYPPFLAVNNQHTMFLKQENGVWKIIFHYYSGASRFRDKTLVVPREAELLSSLKDEFKAVPANSAENARIPSSAAAYNGTNAAEYAKKYTETANPIFYNAGDWQGNCANFTSQCIWAGFGGSGQSDVSNRRFMTSQWYGGDGGGSPAWESVVNFWNYATNSSGSGSKGLHGTVAKSILQLKPGGIIQTRQQGANDAEEAFSHSLLLVDPSTLMLAQNSPNNLIYYSDLVNSEMRFYNTVCLVE